MAMTVNWHSIEGSLVFVDGSGITAFPERLAKRGPVGAEEARKRPPAPAAAESWGCGGS